MTPGERQEDYSISFPVKELIEREVGSLRREFIAQHAATEKALNLFTESTKEKFVAANEWREQSNDREKQLITAQSAFLGKEAYEREHKELLRRVEVLEIFRSQITGKDIAHGQDQSQKNWTNANMIVLGVALFGWVITVIVYVLSTHTPPVK